MTTVFFCCDDALATATTTAPTAAIAVSASSAFIAPFMYALLGFVVSCCSPGSDGRSPRVFLSLHERIERRVQRHRYGMPLRLADERAGDELDLGLPLGLHVLEHRGV